jgi:ubiquinone/menaquinone biosynthesis C-methylase UbiE
VTKKTEIPVEKRIHQLLQHLGIQRAHFATRGLGDLTGLAVQHPELFASLTLVCPALPNRDVLEPLAYRLLVFGGDTSEWDDLGQFVDTLPGATLGTLHKWEPWSDLVARHTESMRTTMLPFLAASTPADMVEITASDGERGAVANISYHIQGAGPPLVLLPLGLIPSQWDSLMPTLIEEYCTITLGGGELGITALLEKRGTMTGYLAMIRSLVQEAGIRPGDAILEVGCGTGAIDRWLSRYTEGKNPITGVDINGYLLREAANLVRLEGLDGAIQLEEGNAEDLPYDDDSYDVTMAVTVMEEVDADKMLAEMIRVTRPGGRVAVIVRAADIPFYINMPLGDALKAKVEDPTFWVSAGRRGCADAGLYRRFQEANLIGVKMFPHLVTFDKPWALDFVQASLKPHFDQAEAAEWHSARALAEAEGTFLWSYPHHCAIGTKPT